MASKLCRIISVLAIFISACSDNNSPPPTSNVGGGLSSAAFPNNTASLVLGGISAKGTLTGGTPPYNIYTQPNPVVATAILSGPNKDTLTIAPIGSGSTSVLIEDSSPNMGDNPSSETLVISIIVARCPAFDPSNQCGHVCTGFPPIPDLGTGFWRGAQGGLYPGGQNTRPATHNAAGLSLANQIVPLNPSGVPDSSSAGAIVFLSVGLSNTEQEFGKFETIVDTVQDKNPYLRTVNGAQGGWEIDRVIDPNATFWDSIDVYLAEESFSNLQVQVIWYKEAEFQPAAVASDTSFPGYPDTLRDKFKITMNIIHDRFPNAKLCYLASRIYGGYDITGGNPEPYAYYTGWCVKWLIEDQINGDPDLAYTDPSAKSPWLSWGTYLWADGLTPRSDGLVWICPDDFKPDGRHPSVTIGREKVALLLLDFFRNDETSKIWFLKKP